MLSDVMTSAAVDIGGPNCPVGCGDKRPPVVVRHFASITAVRSICVKTIHSQITNRLSQKSIVDSGFVSFNRFRTGYFSIVRTTTINHRRRLTAKTPFCCIMFLRKIYSTLVFYARVQWCAGARRLLNSLLVNLSVTRSGKPVRPDFKRLKRRAVKMFSTK